MTDDNSPVPNAETTVLNGVSSGPFLRGASLLGLLHDGHFRMFYHITGRVQHLNFEPKVSPLNQLHLPLFLSCEVLGNQTFDQLQLSSIKYRNVRSFTTVR